MQVESERGPVVVVSGLIASGKSTVSRAVTEALGAVRLEADRVRRTLLQAFGDDEAGTEARWRHDLSPGFEAEIYADLLRRADEAAADGEAIVLDAIFPLRSQRRAVRAMARRHGRPFLLVRCQVPDALRKARLADRDQTIGRKAWDVIDRRLIDHYEPPDELDERERFDVVSDGPIEPIVASIEGALKHAHVPDPTEAQEILRPKVVSFDCWGTLLSEEDWHWAHGLRITALQQAAREAGRDVEYETARTAFEAAWHRHQELWRSGRASGAHEVAEWGLEALGLDDAEAARERLVRRFEEASHTGEVVGLAGARELLAALAASGIPCVLVCDTGLTPGRVVRKLLDHNGLLEHLTVQAFSDEVGAPKPDRRPFLAALEPLGLAPVDTLHVGDLRRTDIAGARALGMTTARIRARHDDTSEEGPEAHHVVDSHADLAALLGMHLD